jgi:hypothetical protein
MAFRVRPDERNLARLSVALVREFGGVLEHPERSDLWRAQRLPPVNTIDQFGGFTLPVDQFWWGHKARKRTLLYIVGVSPRDVPAIPFVMGEAPMCVGQSKKRKDGTRRQLKPEISKSEREHTPPEFCTWLVELARRCAV